MVDKKSNEKNVEQKIDMSWVKTLLNNLSLLKWVKIYSADNLLGDNKLVESMGVKCSDKTISVADNTLSKIIATDSVFEGKEIVRFSVAQLKPIFDNFKKEIEKGELIIIDNGRKDMAIELKESHTVIMVCPMPKTDKS